MRFRRNRVIRAIVGLALATLISGSVGGTPATAAPNTVIHAYFLCSAGKKGKDYGALKIVSRKKYDFAFGKGVVVPAETPPEPRRYTYNKRRHVIRFRKGLLRGIRARYHYQNLPFIGEFGSTVTFRSDGVRVTCTTNLG